MAELALVICVLLAVVLGIVDFGRAINYWNDESHLANQAARFAAVGVLPASGQCPNEPSLSAYISCEVNIDSPELANGSSGHGPQGTLGICVSIPTAAIGQPVTVKLTTTYNWLPLPSLGGAITFANTAISGTATMRLEQTPPAGWATTTGACP
jgi:hypothetical protein